MLTTLLRPLDAGDPPEPALPPPDALLFNSDRTGNHEVYRVAPSGDVVQLTNDSDFDSWWAKPSPDGRKILCCRTPDGVHDTDLEQVAVWTMSSDGSDLVEVLEVGHEGWSLMGHPVWTPDGQVVLFAGVSGVVQLVRLTGEFTSPEVISVTGQSAVNKYDPSVGVDGNVYYRNGTDGQIYRVSLEGGSPTKVTDNEWSNYDPYLSPDGSRLAWLVNVTGDEWSLRIAEPDGSNADWLINDGQINSKPAWSLDNQRVYFHRNPPGQEGGTFGLFWIPAEGGEHVEVSEGPGSSEYPTPAIPVAYPVVTGGDDMLGILNQLAGTQGLELVGVLNALAETEGLEAAGAANALAGTQGLELVGALNVWAGTWGLEAQGAVQAKAAQS